MTMQEDLFSESQVSQQQPTEMCVAAVSQEFAKAVLKIFGGLDKEPKTEEALKELRKEIQKFPTPALAERFADDWLSTEEVWPKVVNVRRAVAAAKSEARRKEKEQEFRQRRSFSLAQNVRIKATLSVTDVLKDADAVMVRNWTM
jgi:hypothetical protein